MVSRNLNMLDLRYTTQLQYFVITVVVLFTYLVGVLIAFMTGQLRESFVSASTVSIAFLSACLILIFRFRRNMRAILEEIQGM